MNSNKSIKRESFDEIVFENRNKEYGAYKIRKTYNKNTSKALMIAVFIVLVAAVSQLIASYNADSSKKFEKEVLIDIADIKNKTDEQTPPPPPPPINKELQNIAKYEIPKIVDSITEPFQMLTNDEGIERNVKTTLDTATVILTKTTEGNTEEVVTNLRKQPFTIVEEMPKFPGGDGELTKFIIEHVKYPPVARENNIQGKVYVRFLINFNGNVDQVSVLRKVDPLLDEEAVRVVKLLPKWTPGKQRGVAVNVWFTVPIDFKLN